MSRARAVALLRRMVSPAALTRQELSYVAAALAALGLFAFYKHIQDGGFYYDDWANAATVHYGAHGISGVESLAQTSPQRPFLILYEPLVHWAFGYHQHFHLAWAAVLAVLVAVALFAVLRELGMELLHASVIAALALLYPYADSTWLWSTASHAHLALATSLVGVFVALRGLRAGGRRAFWTHAAAIALYVLAVLDYELVAPPAMLFGLLYWWRAGWQRARTRWLLDGLAISLTLLLVTSNSAQKRQSFGGSLHHVHLIADQALSVFASTAAPIGSPGRATVLVLALLVVLAAGVVARALPAPDPARAELRRWLSIAAAGVLVAAAGYVLFIPADSYYSPLTLGLGNRVNVIAGIGLVVIVYSLIMLAAALVFRTLHGSRTLALLSVVAACAVLGVGYVRQIDSDTLRWDTAYSEQLRVLALLKSALPNPARGSTIFMFGVEGFYTPGVLVFGSSWDLNGAVKRLYNSGDVTAYPLYGARTGVRCDRGGVQPYGAGYGPAQRAPYGKTVLVDLSRRHRRVRPIYDLRQCKRTPPTFRAGPIVLYAR